MVQCLSRELLWALSALLRLLVHRTSLGLPQSPLGLLVLAVLCLLGVQAACLLELLLHIQSVALLVQEQLQRTLSSEMGFGGILAMRTRLLVFALLTSTALACGTERWDVKTLADAGSASIDFNALPSSVDHLLMYPAPKNLRKLTSRVRPTETHVWRINALIIGMKQEADGDYHIVIGSPSFPTRTMIAEVPDPQCVPEAYRPQIVAVREWIIHILWTPGNYKKLPTPLLVTMTGVGFFDFLHGQTGVAHNGVELHPVLSIEKSGTTSFIDEDDLPYGN